MLNISSSLFLFSLFNAIILALIIGNYRPSIEESDEGWPSSYGNGEVAHEVNGYENDGEENNVRKESELSNGDRYDEDNDSSGSDVDNEENVGKRESKWSDGYDEDEDSSGSDGEIGWDEDENEVEDISLRRRIEEFIAEVNKRWREEWLEDNLNDNSYSSEVS
ncbi:hypothetical protein M5689_007909 [Euphorbia peplus]|nr:hypothetical protein M5689_007909 [Euphorbia peplus]